MMIRYDSYKDSGIEWIGEIPIHWKIMTNKYFTQSQNNKSETGEEELLSVSEYKGVIPRRNIREGEEHLSRSESLVGYLKVRKGELVSNIMLMWKRGLGVSEYEGIVSPSYSVFSFQNSYPKYYHYLFRTDQYVSEFRRNSTGVIESRLRLYDDKFGSIKSHFPPLPEQQQIVSFLDTKTSLIDSLIEKTQRKIELLKEKRTSLINEIVTKGLNPNVEMKDSGVEWIGEIPSHWGIGKLYQYSEMSNGSTPSRVKPEYWENGTIPWMSSGEINKKKIREIDGRITQEGFENSSTKLLPIGTVMMGLNGQGKTKGTVGILEIETTCNQSLCGMIFNDYINPMFSYYFLDSQYFHLRGLVGEGQREGISVSFLSRYPLVVPPLKEQQQIVEYLDEQTQKIDKTISIEEKRIELLKEYRQSLISEVVTGKRKVV